MTILRVGRSRRRGDVLALVALVLLGVGFLFEMVAMDAVPVARDVQLFFIPHKHILWTSLQELEIPFWTPYIRTGYPVLANFQSGVFYPPHWLYAVLPFLTGFNILIVLHLVLAGVGTYALCRRLDFGPVPAWVAGVSYMIGGYLVSLTNLINVLQTAAWAPAMIAVLLHHVRSWRPVTLAGLVAVYLMGFLAGEPQTYLLVSGIAACFAFVWAGGRSDVSRCRKRVMVAMAVTASAVAGLAAIQILPTLQMVSHAGRGNGLPLDQAGRYSLTPIRLVHLLLPNDFSDPVYRFGRKLQLTDVEPWLYSVYIGISGLVLAWHARWDRARRRLVVFWWLVAVLGVLLALGINLPIFRWLHAYVPGFSAFRYPEKFFVLTGLAVPLLAAHGTRGLLAQPHPDRLDLVAALGALAGALATYTAWVVAPDRILAWIERLSSNAPLLESLPFAYVEWGKNLEIALVVLAVTVASVGLVRRRWIRHTSFAALICVLVPLDYWLANRSMNPVVDRSFYTRTPAVAEVMPLAEVGRRFRYRAGPYEEHLGGFYSFPGLPTEAAKWMWQQTIQPATGALWGVLGHGAPDAIHLNVIRAKDELLRNVGLPRRRRLLRLGSVKYVYHPLSSVNFPRSKIAKVDSVPGYVYRFENPLPRAYLAHGRIFDERIDALNALLAPNAPFRRQASILLADEARSGPGERGEDGPTPPKAGRLSAGDIAAAAESAGSTREMDDSAPARDGSAEDPDFGGGGWTEEPPPSPGSARILSDEGEEIRIQVDPDTASYLVLTDTWYPGWHALVDGEERPVRNANYFFKAVRVNPGDETVVFRYRSAPFRRGAWISAASLLLLLAGLGGWKIRRDRGDDGGAAAPRGQGREGATPRPRGPSGPGVRGGGRP